MIGKITRQCIKWPREAAANKCRKSLNQKDTEISDGNNLLDHLAHSLRPRAGLLRVSRTLKNPKNFIQDTCKNLLKGRAISQEVIKNLPNPLSARVRARCSEHAEAPRCQRASNGTHTRGCRVY